MELLRAKIDATERSISPKMIINNIAKAMIIISLVFEKIYEKLSEVKNPSVVVDAITITTSSSPIIAVSQLLRTCTALGKIDISRSSP